MNASSPFNISRSGGTTFGVSFPSSSRNQQRPVLHASAPNITAEELRDQLREASAGLVSAFQGLTTKTRPLYSTSFFTTPSIVAKVNGIGARVNPVVDSYSVLQTTEK